MNNRAQPGDLLRRRREERLIVGVSGPRALGRQPRLLARLADAEDAG